MSSVINFTNKSRKYNRKKEIKIFITIGVLLFLTIIFYTYIKNAPIFISDFPIIKIETESEPNYEDYVDCTFELNNCDDPKSA